MLTTINPQIEGETIHRTNIDKVNYGGYDTYVSLDKKNDLEILLSLIGHQDADNFLRYVASSEATRGQAPIISKKCKSILRKLCDDGYTIDHLVEIATEYRSSIYNKEVYSEEYNKLSTEYKNELLSMQSEVKGLVDFIDKDMSVEGLLSDGFLEEVRKSYQNPHTKDYSGRILMAYYQKIQPLCVGEKNLDTIVELIKKMLEGSNDDKLIIISHIK